MDLKGLKARRTKLETDIRNLLLRFGQETGLEVDGVHFQMWVDDGKAHCTALRVSINVFSDD